MCDNYLNYVKQEAYKLGYMFFLDSGEGRECKKIYKNWNIEDLSGWLISKEQELEFLEAKKNNKVNDFDGCYVFVRWYMSNKNNLRIKFKKY